MRLEIRLEQTHKYRMKVTVVSALIVGISAAAVFAADPDISKLPAPAAKKVATKSATGTVKSTTPDSLMLVTEGKDKKTKEWTFVLDKDTKITKAGKPAEAKDLADKDMATVTYTEAEGKMHAKSVVVKKAS